MPGSKDRFTYRVIPPKFYDTVIDRILELVAARRVTEIPRDYGLPPEPNIRPIAVVLALALSLPIVLVLTMIEGRRLLLPG